MEQQFICYYHIIALWISQRSFHCYFISVKLCQVYCCNKLGSLHSCSTYFYRIFLSMQLTACDPSKAVGWSPYRRTRWADGLAWFLFSCRLLQFCADLAEAINSTTRLIMRILQLILQHRCEMHAKSRSHLSVVTWQHVQQPAPAAKRAGSIF
jgi:hypothetical protein